jgi:fibronectin-binding autotransporter adhesin
MDMTSYTWNGVSGDWNLGSNWKPAGGPPTASDSATINGTAADTITVDSADVADSLTLSDANATLNDAGSSASLTIGGAFTMSAGTLNISRSKDGGVLTIGALDLSGGALNVNDNGKLDLNGTLSQTGGTLTLGPGGTISGGTIDSTGGRLVFDGGFHGLHAGTLSGVTFEGPLNLTANGASVRFANGTTVVGSSGSGPGTINDTGKQSHLFFNYSNTTQTISNTTINLGNAISYSEIEQDDSYVKNLVLTLASSVTVNVAGNADIDGGASSGDRIVNQGAIDVTGSGGNLTVYGEAFTNPGTIDIANGDSVDLDALALVNSGTIDANGSLEIGTGAFTNSGTINVANGETASIYVTKGTVTGDGTVTGKGTFTISGDSTLEFDAKVSGAKTLGDQDIDFTGGGTLDLLKPAGFNGEISGFKAGDTIELLGSWDFSSISPGADVTTLTLAKGSTTHAFEFAGDYTQSEFSFTPGKTTTIGFA